MGKQAIDAERKTTFLVDPDNLVIVGLDTKDGPEHPLWDKRIELPVDENLVQDMLMNGFHGAIEVRKNGEKIEVVTGRQRVRSARKANEWAKSKNREKILVTCIVVKGQDADLFGFRIGENAHRRGLSVLEKADEVQRYLALGRSEKQAAVSFGMTEANVKNLTRLLDLDGSVRKAVEAGDLSASAAADLSGLSREDQKEELKKLLASGQKITARVVKHATKVKKKGEEAITAPPKRLVTKILKLDKKNGGVLTSDFIRGVMWVLGDISSKSIKGLTALEEEARAKKSAEA